jgi:hypothetical protein
MGSEFETRTVPSAVETMMLVCRPTWVWSDPEKEPWRLLSVSVPALR